MAGWPRALKWLAPGMRIKRWILLATVGLTIFSVGLLLMAQRFQTLKLETINLRFGPTDGLLLMGGGLVVVGWSLRRWFSILGSAMVPSYQQDRQLVEVLYERRHLQQGLKIVTIGGGTGLSTLLRGLKSYSSNLCAVVTVSDDGGSSGRLVKEMGVLPPGDIRNCLVALADDESLLSELFHFRFKDGDLQGHSFGNLFLAALTEVAGDFEAAVKLSSQILATRGRVLPATLTSVTLCARYDDGSSVRGESAIPKKGQRIERVYLDPAVCKPPNEVLLALADADAIVFGPGSLYTSVIPNLLVDGIAQAVSRSPALKIYVCNVMTQPGETDGMGAADHVQALLNHAGISLDYVVVNLGDPTRLFEKYAAEGATPVEPQLDRLNELGVQAVGARLLHETEQVRHDPERLARTIVDLLARNRSKEPASHSRRLRLVK